MEMILEGLKPYNVFKYFEEISSIPRETGNCKAISDYICDFAVSHNLIYFRDDFDNVVIYKDSTTNPDGETVILQGHMDMVCEKSFDYEAKHDFSKDGLKLSYLDDYIFSKGTTLGADDGIAIAYMLSILEDDLLKTPPIEALFTVDEENGMKGAINFDASVLKGKKLINLDHEVEGELLTCCAGGRRVKLRIPVNYTTHEGICYSIIVCGLNGGHSGVEIDKGRGNANLLLGRMLHTISKNINFELKYIGGGLTDSAIPREAKAEILIDSSAVDTLEDIVEKYSHIICNEFEGIEDNMMIYCENKGEEEAKVLQTNYKKQIGFLLNTIPDGIIKMSRKNEGLVRTSLNCGIMQLSEEHFTLIVNLRSLADSEKEALGDKIQYLIETIGGEYIIETDYPAWEYNENSPLRELAFDVFQNKYCRNPKMKGFHAGLECGVLFGKIKDLDILSLGPTIINIHTPKEKLSISSTERTYDYLVSLLEALS